jgi:alpha-L-rhamnosidase
MKRLVLVLTVCMLSPLAQAADQGVSPGRLRCEYRINPLGVDVVKPRFNWIVLSDAAGQKQTAYRLLAASSQEKLTADTGDLWDSGKIESDQTTHVVYKGKQLKSEMRCWWKVRIWGADGKASDWSKPAMWSMGLLKQSDWKAKWIAAAEDSPASEAGVMPATMLRKSFKITGPIKRATVHVSGLGVYDLHINGKRVGDSILAPGFTMYRSRVQYQTFDVTELLTEGDNAAGAVLSDGWNGEYFFGMPMRQTQRPFEGRRGFIMQLEVELADGKTQTILTDKSWRSTPSASGCGAILSV